LGGCSAIIDSNSGARLRAGHQPIPSLPKLFDARPCLLADSLFLPLGVLHGENPSKQVEENKRPKPYQEHKKEPVVRRTPGVVQRKQNRTPSFEKYGCDDRIQSDTSVVKAVDTIEWREKGRSSREAP
jgi:hypothetical protein